MLAREWKGMSYQGITAETVKFKGHNGDEGEAGLRGVRHNSPPHGSAAISHHQYFRDGPGSPDDVGARVRAAGGVADAQVVGDTKGAMDFLRAQPNATGKIGLIGFCSGGRHVYLCACSLPGIDAAVDCWGGNVVVDDKKQLDAKKPVAPIDLTDKLTAPLLGIFGNDDQNPNKDHVNRTEEVLKRLGKNYEFHRYDGCGPAFFTTARAAFRPEQAADGWSKVFAFYKKHLG